VTDPSEVLNNRLPNVAGILDQKDAHAFRHLG
jgi:hypothetical protein